MNLFVPIEVFYSYAHEDEGLRRELEKHLVLLTREKLVRSWHDRKILAGKVLASEIDNHLNTAGLFLPLVSPDFLNSEYCFSVELTRALERHKADEMRIVPVILRPCDWKHSPLSQLNALPKDGQPIVLWGNRDSALLNVAEGVREAVLEVGATRARIVSPKNGETVDRKVKVEGTVRNLPADIDLWAVSQAGSGLAFHPHHEAATGLGDSWTSWAYLGSSSPGANSGGKFLLHVVASDAGQTARFRAYLEGGKKANRWPGLSDLAGAQILSTIKVSRR